MPEGQYKSQTKLVRMSNELFEILAQDAGHDNISIDWGKPTEYVLTDDHGKQYMEPVYSPVVYIEEIADKEKA